MKQKNIRISFTSVVENFNKKKFVLLTAESEYSGINTLMSFICPKHGLQRLKYNAFKTSRYGCKQCGIEARTAIQTKYTTSQINQKIVVSGFLIDPDFEWKSSSKQVSFICPKHGLQKKDWSNFLKGTDCLKCSREKPRKNKQDWETKIKNLLYSRNFELIEAPLTWGSYSKFKVLCKEDGHTWVTNYNRLNRFKHGCLKCNRTLKISFLDAKFTIESKGYNVLSEEPTKFLGTTEIKVKCPLGHITTTAYSRFVQGYGCKYCAGVNLNEDEVKKRLEEINLRMKDPYTKSKDVFEFECGKGHTFKTTLEKILYNKNCPKCKPPYTSKGEEEIAEWLKTFLPENSIERNDRKLLNGHEIDILIPSKKLGIEYSGVYFHNEISFLNRGKTLKEAKTYHQSKSIRAKKAGVQLITIWDVEWSLRKDAIKSRLKSLLGLNTHRYGARKTEVREVFDKPLIDDFLNRYHVQGTARFSRAFGLFYGGSLVSVMTFSLPHRQNMYKDSLVLNRYCVKEDNTVQGGASKLFTYCTSMLKVPIISYSDNRWSTGNIYKQLGFTRIKNNPPDYFYVTKFGKLFSKQSKRKGKEEVISGKTERDLRLNEGLYRVWDCGKSTWLFTE